MRPDQDAIEALARELYELWADLNDPEWDALPSTDECRADYIAAAVRLADAYLAKMPMKWAVKTNTGTFLGDTKEDAARKAYICAGHYNWPTVSVALVEIPEGT